MGPNDQRPLEMNVKGDLNERFMGGYGRSSSVMEILGKKF